MSTAFLIDATSIVNLVLVEVKGISLMNWLMKYAEDSNNKIYIPNFIIENEKTKVLKNILKKMNIYSEDDYVRIESFFNKEAKKYKMNENISKAYMQCLHTLIKLMDNLYKQISNVPYEEYLLV